MHCRTESHKRIPCVTTLKSGFTLVEVMVSMVIMLIVVSVAFSGFRVGLNAWEHGGKALDEMGRRSTVEQLIQRQLAVAFPLEFRDDQESFIMFRGSSERIEFVSDYSLVDGPADFRKIDYAIQDGRFLYGENPIFGYVPQEHDPLPTTTLAKFKQVSFEFLGRDKQDKPAWLSDWKLGSGVPVAIQVHIDDDTFVVRMVNR